MKASSMVGPRTVDKSAAENPGEHHYLAIGLCTLGHSQPRDPTYPVTGGRLVTIVPALRLIVEQPATTTNQKRPTVQ